MKTTLYIPVLDITTENFDYKGELDINEYEDMVYDHFKKTDKQIDNFMSGFGDNNTEKNNEKTSGGDYDIDSTDDEGYKLSPCEANVTDMNGSDINKDFFSSIIDEKKMSILIIDINPEKIDWDTSSELKFWMGDSDRVLRDNSIDDDTKIKTLPKTHFFIDVDKERYKLSGCKLIEMYTEKNHPYKFGVLVNNISKS